MMHGPLPDRTTAPVAATSPVLVAALAYTLAWCNRVILVLASLALIAACGRTQLQRDWARAVSEPELLAG